MKQGHVMTINPLESHYPAPELPGPATGAKPAPASSAFAELLGSLNKPAAGSPQGAAQAAADLFRIRMMQTSLSLFRDEESASPGALPVLENLLAGPAQMTCKSPVAAAPSFPSQSALAGEAEAPMSVPDPAGGIEAAAESYLGTPYRFGGEGADGIDCSSFVQKVFRENRIELPRTAREQSKMGADVAPQDLRKGDLLFFHTYASYPSHVGIYLGNGKMIHASSGRGEVAISDVNSDFYRARFMGAKRVTGEGDGAV